jgi:hypothetical protein
MINKNIEYGVIGRNMDPSHSTQWQSMRKNIYIQYIWFEQV